MTQKEVAKMLGKSERTIRLWIKTGKFDAPCRREEISGRRVEGGYRKSHVIKWAEKNGIVIKEEM